MNRPILVCALLLMATASVIAQEDSQSSPYQGTSTPPPDDTIVTTSTPQAKPNAGHRAMPAQNQVQPHAQTKAPVQAQSAYADPAVNNTDPDSGIVGVQRNATPQREPALTQRSNAADPDEDIVHPHPARPGELPEGTTIRVRLLDRLSSVSSEKGETFRCSVASEIGRRRRASASSAPRRTPGRDHHPRSPAGSAFVREQREGRDLSL